MMVCVLLILILMWVFVFCSFLVLLLVVGCLGVLDFTYRFGYFVIVIIFI